MATEQVPPAVERAAERQGLGPLVTAHQARPGSRKAVRTLLLIGSGLVVPGCVLVWAGSAWGSAPLGVAGRVLLVAGLAVLLAGARTHLRRPQHYYLYAGGLAHQGSRKVQAVTWSEITHLTRRRVSGRALTRTSVPREAVGGDGDPVVGYVLARGNGEVIGFRLYGKDGADARFSSRMERAAAEAGVHIRG